MSAISDYELKEAQNNPDTAQRWKTVKTEEGGFLSDPGAFSFSQLRRGIWFFYASSSDYHGKVAKAQVASETTRTADPNPIKLYWQAPNQGTPPTPTHSPHLLLILFPGSESRPQTNSQTTPCVHVHSPSCLTGRVFDERGQPISGSLVSIYTPEFTGVLRTATARTDGLGRYEIDTSTQPKASEYLLTAAKYGYESQVFVILGLSSPPKDPIQLNPLGDFGEITGEQPGDASRLRIFTAAVGRTLEAVPLPASRSLDSLALLSAGILPPPETREREGPSFAPGIGTAGAFAANGLRSREVSFILDGGDDNDELVGARRQGFLFSSSLPPEGIQEFQVVSALPDARLGLGTSAQINVISKPNFGDFHASIYGFLTNDALRARDFFDDTAASLPTRFPLLRPSDGTPVFLDGQELFVANPTPKRDWKRVQPGLLIGGPARRVYLSAGFDGLIERGERQKQFSVPTVDERRLPSPILQQLPNGSFPVTVPGDAVFSFFPFPNNPAGPFGANTFTAALPVDGTGARWFARLDQKENSTPENESRNGGKYSHSIEDAVLPSAGGAIGSMLDSHIQNVDLAYFLGWESLTWAHGFRMDVGWTLAHLSPHLPAVLRPNTPLLLDATPVAGGLVSQDEQYASASSPTGAAMLSALGYSGNVTSREVLGPFGQLQVAGFSPVGIDPFFLPQRRTNLTIQIAYAGSIAHGNRVSLLGFDVRYRRSDTRNNPNSNPEIAFSGLPSVFSGSAPTADASPSGLAAAGLPTGVFQTFLDFRTGYKSQDDRSLNSYQDSFYFQHERSVQPNLRLTAGLRFEINGVSEDYSPSLASLFDRSQLLKDAAAAEAACTSPCPGFAAAIGQAFPANYAQFTTPPVSIGPRVGIAWNPHGRQSWSIRVGYGIFNGVLPGFAGSDLRQGFNRFVPLNVANSPLFTNQGEFLLNLANPLVRQLSPGLNIVPSNAISFSEISVNPLLLLTSTLSNLGSFGAPPTFSSLALLKAQLSVSSPYAQHYAFTIERELGKTTVSVAYVGSRGINLLRPETPQGGPLRSSLTINQIGVVAGGFPAISATSKPAQPTLAGGIVGIAPTIYSSSASSTFNSLQAEFRGRLIEGVQINSSYTYSHAIDDVSDFFDLAGAFALPQNSSVSERASANFDIRHRLTGSFIWDIAPHQSSRWFGNWQFAGLWTIQSGQPFTVNSAFDINGDGNLTDRLNNTQGLLVGPFTDDSTTLLHLAPSVSPRSLVAADGMDGQIGRNTFRSWGIRTADIAATKTIALRRSEFKRLVLRLEAFNAFNHPQFAIPIRVVEAPGFGKAVQTTIAARTFQIAAKWLF